jgi:accessory gene regulator B
VIGAIVKGIMLVGISLVLGVLLPTLIITVTFASLRMLAGGYHMDTYGKCIFVSLGLFIVSSLVANYTYANWQGVHIILLILVTFILGLYVLIRYAPKDTPNKPITSPDEIRKFKRLSIMYLFVWGAVVSGLAFLALYLYVLSLCFGILLELFAISPTGHKFFDAVKKGMSIKNS